MYSGSLPWTNLHDRRRGELWVETGVADIKHSVFGKGMRYYYRITLCIDRPPGTVQSSFTDPSSGGNELRIVQV